MRSVDTPPWRIRSSRRRPTSFWTKDVATAVFIPKQRRRPRAALYSPPPSQALNEQVVRTRPSPGSSLSMISPKETRSHLHSEAGRRSSVFISQEAGQMAIRKLFRIEREVGVSFSWANSFQFFYAEKKALVLFGFEGELGLHFTGEKTVFVSFFENVVQHGLQVGLLVTVSAKLPASKLRGG